MIPHRVQKIKALSHILRHFSAKKHAGTKKHGRKKSSLPRICIKKMSVSVACKPSSVFGGHLSRPTVTGGFKRNPESLTGRLKRSFVSCSEWGLHRGQVAKPRVSSYLAFPPLHAKGVRYLSVALSLGSPPPGVTRHPALRSSDFPHTLRRAAARQPHKRVDYSTFCRFCQPWCDSPISASSSPSISSSRLITMCTVNRRALMGTTIAKRG